MWLNVSAILWNEKLKKISNEQERSDPFEFDYIQEINDEIVEDKE